MVEHHWYKHFNCTFSTWLAFCLSTCLPELACVRWNLHSSALLGAQISSFCVFQGQRLPVHRNLFSPPPIVAGYVVSYHFPTSPAVSYGLRLVLLMDDECKWLASNSMLSPFSGSLDDDAQGNLESHMLEMEELPSLWVLEWLDTPCGLLWVQERDFLLGFNHSVLGLSLQFSRLQLTNILPWHFD